jgi:hypothetical protein
VPFVSLASPFTPSGNTVLVTGGASGIDELAFNLTCAVCALKHFRHWPRYCCKVAGSRKYC